MTAYNRQKYIAEAIESLLASTYCNFELIIVDDCSKDNTLKIAKEYEAKDQRIRVYANEKNLGDYSNRNKATSYAKGEFVMFLDSDDKTYPDSIEYCVDQMLKTPEAQMGIFCWQKSLCGSLLSPKESINYHFFKTPFLTVGPGGTILKRNFFEQIEKYPEKYGPANDMYFNLKAASKGYIKCLCKEFFFYRIHEGQEANNKYSYLINNYCYLKDALKELSLPLTDQEKKWLDKKNKRRFTVNIFKYFLKNFDLIKTRNAVRQAQFSIKDALQGIFHL